MIVSSVLKCLGDGLTAPAAAAAAAAVDPPRPSTRSVDAVDHTSVATEDRPSRSKSRAASPTRAMASKYGRFHSQFNLLKQQKQRGREVAAQVLESYSDGLEQMNLGILVGYLLHEFGEEMRSGRHGYSVRFGWLRFNVDEDEPFPHPHCNDPLLVEDPIHLTNNVAKNCYKAQAISRAFREAGDNFEAAVAAGREGGFEQADVLGKVFGKIPSLAV